MKMVGIPGQGRVRGDTQYTWDRERRQSERQMTVDSRAHTPTPQNETIKHKIWQGGARTIRGVMGACLTCF